MNSTSTLTSSSSSTPTLLPRDARLIALLLAANGAEDCEEGVVRMLVEFAHRYTSDVLTDSLLYADHARSTSQATLTPSIDDIRLAIQQRTESASVPKEFLLQLATQVNSVPLPTVPEVYGIRLPPTSQRLTAPNFSIVPRSNPVVDPNVPVETRDFGGEGTATQEGSEMGGGGLFGDDDDDDEDDEDDEDEDEDDEEMEDVTAGLGGSGNMEGGAVSSGNAGLSGAGGVNGTKRKAGESDEEYD